MMNLTSHPLTSAVTWALLHFVWQGASIGLGAALWLRLARPGALARYRLGVATLALMLFAPILTTGVLLTGTDAERRGPMPSAAIAWSNASPGRGWIGAGSSHTGSMEADDALAAILTASGEARRLLEAAQPVVLPIWMLGVAIFASRLAGGWALARRAAGRAHRPIPASVHALARRLAARMKLTRLIRIVESPLVSVPMLVGCLKPVVLLPSAALAGLPPAQLEALLAHELAHVRRHDYLVNLLQACVETLLFYHPAVWWMSRQVRLDRELCCDDMAVEACGDRVAYASALAAVAAMAAPQRFMLAASDGRVLTRVRRVLGTLPDEGRGAAGTASLALALLLGLVPAALAGSGSPARPQSPSPAPAPEASTPAPASRDDGSDVPRAQPEATPVPSGDAARLEQEVREARTAATLMAGEQRAQARARAAASREAVQVTTEEHLRELEARMAELRARGLLTAEDQQRHAEAMQRELQALQAELQSGQREAEIEARAAALRAIAEGTQREMAIASQVRQEALRARQEDIQRRAEALRESVARGDALDDIRPEAVQTDGDMRMAAAASLEAQRQRLELELRELTERVRSVERRIQELRQWSQGAARGDAPPPPPPPPPPPAAAPARPPTPVQPPMPPAVGSSEMRPAPPAAVPAPPAPPAPPVPQEDGQQ